MKLSKLTLLFLVPSIFSLYTADADGMSALTSKAGSLKSKISSIVSKKNTTKPAQTNEDASVSQVTNSNADQAVDNKSSQTNSLKSKLKAIKNKALEAVAVSKPQSESNDNDQTISTESTIAVANEAALKEANEANKDKSLEVVAASEPQNESNDNDQTISTESTIADVQNDIVQQLSPDGQSINLDGKFYQLSSIEKIETLFENTNLELSRLIRLKNLDDSDIPYLLKKFSSIETDRITLDLSGNNFSPEGIYRILNGLKSSPNLLYVLNLSGIQLGNNGLLQIIECSKNLPMLDMVILRNAGINEQGLLFAIKEICSFKNEIRLQTLDLSNNMIDKSYLTLIFNMLRKNDDVLSEGLILSGNNEGLSVPSNVIMRAQTLNHEEEVNEVREAITEEEHPNENSTIQNGIAKAIDIGSKILNQNNDDTLNNGQTPANKDKISNVVNIGSQILGLNQKTEQTSSFQESSQNTQQTKSSRISGALSKVTSRLNF